MKELPVLEFKAQEEWEAWLDKNHGQPDGVWLKFAKKNSGESTIQYPQALDEALCYGWIDGQAKGLDEKFWLVKFTPRRPKSVWSYNNRLNIERLIAAGKMKPAGLAQVDAAKADGRWKMAYQSPANATVPEDFKKALSANKKAADFFETLTKSNRFSIIWRVNNAKKPETRAANIEKFVAMLANHRAPQ